MRAATALALSMLATAPALGADFPVLRGAFTPASAPRAASDDQSQWEGFYIGGFAGYGSGRFGSFRSANAIVADQFRLTALESEATVSNWLKLQGGVDRGVSYGGFIGYNMAFGDAVIGLEADVSRISLETTAHEVFGRQLNTANGYRNNVVLDATAKAKLDAYGTVRARVGWAAGWFMPFLTGGVAIGKGSHSTRVISYLDAVDSTVPAVLPPVNRIYDDTRSNSNAYTFGGTIGAGVDALIASNILLRAEYQYVRFGTVGAMPLDIHVVRAGAGVKF